MNIKHASKCFPLQWLQKNWYAWQKPSRFLIFSARPFRIYPFCLCDPLMWWKLPHHNLIKLFLSGRSHHSYCGALQHTMPEPHDVMRRAGTSFLNIPTTLVAAHRHTCFCDPPRLSFKHHPTRSSPLTLRTKVVVHSAKILFLASSKERSKSNSWDNTTSSQIPIAARKCTPSWRAVLFTSQKRLQDTVVVVRSKWS